MNRKCGTFKLLKCVSVLTPRDERVKNLPYIKALVHTTGLNHCARAFIQAVLNNINNGCSEGFNIWANESEE